MEPIAGNGFFYGFIISSGGNRTTLDTVHPIVAPHGVRWEVKGRWRKGPSTQMVYIYWRERGRKG